MNEPQNKKMLKVKCPNEFSTYEKTLDVSIFMGMFYLMHSIYLLIPCKWIAEEILLRLQVIIEEICLTLHLLTVNVSQNEFN